jgi:hypothetical protein
LVGVFLHTAHHDVLTPMLPALSEERDGVWGPRGAGSVVKMMNSV